MRKFTVITALLCVILSAGCRQAKAGDQEEQAGDYFTSMEAEPELSYEIPASAPGILVNQLGYMTESSKIAVFKGKEIPDRFHVIDAESGETIYTGFLEEQEYDKASDAYNSCGDFTALTVPGTYYIDAPILGRSYSFRIADDVYDRFFKESCKEYYYNRCGMTLTSEYAGEYAHNACHIGKAVLGEDVSVSMDVSGGWHQDEKGQKDVVTAAKAMSVMMLAYELYGESFGDDTGIPESGNHIPDILDEIRYEAEWLLKMQDQQTGAVYSGLVVYQQGSDLGKSTGIYVEAADSEAEKAFAMAMAKFSYLYQSYDTEYATICLKAAGRAFKHAELNEEKKQDAWEFAAAAELYRAAGQTAYQKYVINFLKAEELEERDEVVLVGCVTYIATKQPVNVNLCEKIMKMLMTQAEDISETAEASLYMTAEGGEWDTDSLLLNMMYLTVVNHIISNSEYKTTIENHLHYLLGRNDKAVSFVDVAGENSFEKTDGSRSIMKQFDADSKLIFMLSEIVRP